MEEEEEIKKFKEVLEREAETLAVVIGIKKEKEEKS
jgi:hypothetical protein